MKKYLK